MKNIGTYRELIPSYHSNDKEVKCISCKNKHLIGDRIIKQTNYSYKDYCPKCKKARSYIE